MPVTTPSRRLDLPIVLRKLTVLRTAEVTPRMRRITLGGEQLGAFSAAGHDLPAFTTRGADDYVKLFFPEPGGEPVLPEQHDGHLHWPRKPAPLARAYTVRRYDADLGELDLDFVLHGHGVAGNWARDARPGDEIHLAGPKISTVPPVGASWWLLAGDETALPAVGHYLDDADGTVDLHAFVLVDGPEEEQRELTGVRWVHRRSGVADAELLAQAVRDHSLPEGEGWMWIAGEAGIVRELRAVAKHLGIPKPMLDASGYWRADAGSSALGRIRALRDQAVESLEHRRREHV
ncbi:siderophore-interacting protein [Rhodococcus triatomae]|uniref:NADPH-dependent ferric siderophore reductase, contains FAD-binding and SIP domains n=2 Tax=Rhodococcus triatomae TaxID=300028 RepID=A0A1G7ZPM4_9NOCA|nr:siderophore-interacting protein [Rhodococcus triatomae]QNG25529.1 siderophore-interacting protein [Rhodococcus triatomae]SDH10050.1 NADPH-dependent ferric siderophore reductase, contains FAD-binding and SIP domains [Rhodococcus triatomae]